MQFSFATVLAFASAVFAQTDGFNPIVKPTNFEVVPAGSTFSIEWTPGGAKGPVSIAAFGGPTRGLLQEVAAIAPSVDASLGKFAWSVPTTLGKDVVYGIKLTLLSDPSIFQWSNPFTISGGSTGGAGSSSAVASPSTTGSGSGSTGSASARPTTLAPTTRVGSSISTSAPAAPSTSVVVPPIGNLSSSAGVPRTTTPSTLLPTGGPSATTAASTTIRSAGAVALGAGSFAVLGGVAVAILGM